MGESDRVLFAKRREALVADPAVRDVLGRRATRLGLLVEDLEEIVAELKVTPPESLPPSTTRTELLTGGKVSDALFHVLDTGRVGAADALHRDRAAQNATRPNRATRTTRTAARRPRALDGSDGDDMSDDGDDD